MNETNELQRSMPPTVSKSSHKNTLWCAFSQMFFRVFCFREQKAHAKTTAPDTLLYLALRSGIFSLL
jgi:hypothetical protein